MMKFGVRTIADTATANDDFVPIDEIIEMSVDEETRVIEVEIVDDQGWEPDEDFFIEIYDYDDPQKKKKWGDNCRC